VGKIVKGEAKGSYPTLFLWDVYIRMLGEGYGARMAMLGVKSGRGAGCSGISALG